MKTNNFGLIVLALLLAILAVTQILSYWSERTIDAGYKECGNIFDGHNVIGDDLLRKHDICIKQNGLH
ncbi:hypothetical protein HY346_02040 [Candidatus Microgenomates bacterium]|nr:hypothetical protein [Candidatus Microgenomates bacterium]